MTYSFAFELLDRLLAEGIEELTVPHWEEVALDRDAIPYAPDWDRARRDEKNGYLKIIAMREDGALAGYNAFFVMHHIHYRHTLHALNDVIYCDPAARHWMAGIRLIRESERMLRELGVRKIVYHTKLHVRVGRGTKSGTVGDVLERLGYRHIEDVHAKVLS